VTPTPTATRTGTPTPWPTWTVRPNPGGPWHPGDPGPFPSGPGGQHHGPGNDWQHSWGGGWQVGPGNGPGEFPVDWRHNSPGTPACGSRTDLVTDGGFEEPVLPRGVDSRAYGPFQMPGWRTDDPNGQVLVVDGRRVGVTPAEGDQFSQVNPAGTLYQDLRTRPGGIVFWSFEIRSVDPGDTGAMDTTQVHFGETPVGDQGATNAAGGFTFADSADPGQWTTLSGWYRVPDGQRWTRVSFSSLAGAADRMPDLIDDVQIASTMC
jgi:hypothetical protein